MCSSRHGTLGHEARVNTSHLRKLAAVAAAGFVSLGVAQVTATPAHATSGTHTGASRSGTRTTSSPSGRPSSWTSRATRTGAVRPSTRLQIGVWLKMRNVGELKRVSRAVYTPRSARYHQWLTQHQVMRSYLPTKHDVAVVQHYLRSRG